MLHNSPAFGLLRWRAAHSAGGYADSGGTHENPVPDANYVSGPLAHPRTDADHGTSTCGRNCSELRGNEEFAAGQERV